MKGNSTPTAIVGLAGVTAIETSAALLTVSVVDPLTDPNVAVIVVFPNPVLVAKPVLLIVATPVFVELQLTDAVRNCVLPSLYVPMAVSCCVSPSVFDKIVGLAGVSCSDTSVGDVTLLPSVVAMAAGSSPSETGERPRRDAVRLHLGGSRPNAAELRAHAVLGDDR